ncbi:MAG: fibrobacter succinogenes major paralogous domain-containing protein [Candidatus Peribacteria bacterium]|nr:fibrobacter succinogenes major paralogous domain-containing protein [Candidatus Peribacteria bacterium]
MENFKNDLKLPLAGLRDRLNGSLNNQGSSGHYWSSSPNDIDDVYRLDLHSSEVRPQSDSNRTFGFSVRCFKN